MMHIHTWSSSFTPADPHMISYTFIPSRQEHILTTMVLISEYNVMFYYAETFFSRHCFSTLCVLCKGERTYSVVCQIFFFSVIYNTTMNYCRQGYGDTAKFLRTEKTVFISVE